MMQNLADLIVAIRKRLGGRADLTDAQITEFITLGEAVLNRRLRLLLSMQSKATLALAAGAQESALPSNFLEDIALSRSGKELVRVNLRDLPGETSLTGDPAYFAISSAIRFDVKAASETFLQLDYFAKFEIAETGTNALLTEWPDAYITAALLQAADFSRQTERKLTLERDLGRIITEANERDARVRNAAPLRADILLLNRGAR